ncbi:MAG: DNA polymerase III subunit gamma/tau [Proteobacteria bacterium]|nr:DNA polymerase III subunit gamma/tau [Pseudomonadota bacterium]
MSDAEKSAGASGAATAPPPAAVAGDYRVLARRHRPTTFADLIGQEAMVRTISNAFASGRIPQAWILTGVRGVGNTTTARILARALNYDLADGSITGPTIDMPKLGIHCQAIIESRHVDVLEMDAASHNSVDAVRQINDAIRYSPATARSKVYILDEVHMLSTAAFNALLKTLEEPPPHAKFVFATTEIGKVPVTVRSRCQRFDLRRVESERLVAHLEAIAGKEGVACESDALALIARAAEGSVRDALSLLDQAIAHAGTLGAGVAAAGVRDMLGLADRARVIDLFDALMRGDIACALAELRDQYDSGADPAVVLADLAEFTHFVTRVKIVPAVAEDRSLAEVERIRGRAFAAALSMPVLSRTWQMLLKGLAEVQISARTIAAAEMVLVRIAYVADLPTPDDVVRSLSGETPAGAAPVSNERHLPARPQSPSPAPAPQGVQAPRAMQAPRDAQSPPAARSAPAMRPEPQVAPAMAARALCDFGDIVALAMEKRDLVLKAALERDVRLVRCEDGRLEIALEPGAPRTLVGELSRKLGEWTGRRWMVVVSAEPGAPTLRSQGTARREALETGVRTDPLVRAVLDRFPGAEIIDVREPHAHNGGNANPARANDDDMPQAPPRDEFPDAEMTADETEFDDP